MMNAHSSFLHGDAPPASNAIGGRAAAARVRTADCALEPHRRLELSAEAEYFERVRALGRKGGERGCVQPAIAQSELHLPKKGAGVLRARVREP